MLEELLVAIERSAPAALLRTSFVVYPLVSAAHSIATYVASSRTRRSPERVPIPSLMRNLAPVPPSVRGALEFCEATLARGRGFGKGPAAFDLRWCDEPCGRSRIE